MSVQIVEAVSKSQLKVFVKFVFDLYRGDKNWIPPIIADELKMTDPAKNPAFDFCEAAFWLAYKDGKVAGRISAIINHEYNQLKGIRYGRIARAEFYDDAGVADALFDVAERWLKEKGMTHVHGPLGFTNLDLQGLLIEGFDHLPSIASVYHKPYYQQHFDRLGYVKENDWVEFRLAMASEIPEKARRLADMIKERYKLKVHHFSSTKELTPYGPEVFRLLNRAFSDLPYVAPFNEKLIHYYSEKYFKIINPEFVKIVTDDSGKMAGFIIGVPSLSEAMQKAGGRLFPFGFIHMLRAMKNPVVMDLVLTGVEPHLQGQGVPAVLINELQKVIMEHKIKYVETTGIFETNHKAIVTWKNYEHIQHKRRRCYVKELT
jgi:GNAT superfamily N-acetyltransferase